MYRADVRTPTSPRRLAALLVAAVTLPLALGACSSASSANGATTTTRAAGHSGSTSVCRLITPAQIEQTLGKKVDDAVVANTTAATACTYPATSGQRADSVIIAYRAHVTAAQAGTEQATLAKLHGTLTPVTVTSGQAFSYTEGSGKDQVTSLVTLIGNTQVAVTSTATLDQLENLSQLIFTSLATGPSSTTTTTTAPTTTTTAAG